MRKQFITAVILTAMLVAGCGAAEGDTAVTAAGTEAAATTVAEETAGEEAAAEEESDEVASASIVKADEAGTEEETEEEVESDEEDAESDEEEAESDEEEDESDDEEAESDEEESESEVDVVSDEEDAESDEEEAESDEEDAADSVTAEESKGTPRAYSGRSGRSTSEDKADKAETEAEEDEETEADEETGSEDEEAEAEDADGSSGALSGRPEDARRPSGRPGESGRAPSKDGRNERDKTRDEEYEVFWEDIFPDLEDGEGEYDNFWDVFPDVSDGEYDNFWDMFPDLDTGEGAEADEDHGYSYGLGSDDDKSEGSGRGRESGRDEASGREKGGSRDKVSDGKDEKSGKEPEEDSTKKAEPEFEESEGLTFKSNKDGTCIITGIGTCDDTVIVIPQKSPKGDTVTAIGEGAFDHARGIEGVIFKDLLIEIEPEAFTGSSIESISAYGSSLVINEDAFSDAVDLSYFAAEESEIVADPYAFDSAFDGADLVFTDSTLIFDDASFIYSDVRSMIGRDSTFIIGEDAFDYCEGIETMEFTDCYVDIGAYAFFCSGDEMEILFELSDVTIGEDAFAFSDIINLEINGSTVQIGEDAFDYCDAIENIIVRASVVNTDPYAFYGCGNQAKVVFQNGEVTLGRDAFAFADIASLKMVRCDVEIGPEAFKACTSLRRLDIGSGNINIGKRAFYHCEDLRELTLGENGQGPHSIVIGENAFEFSGLGKVMIGRGSVEIGSGAFKYCENLRDVKIRGAIEKIGRNAFFRCDDDLVIHYGGEDYDARSIQDVVSSLEDDTPQPSLRKDARSRTILRASFDGSSFGDSYQLGEVWNVPGQWKITIDSVYETGERSEASEHEPAAVYVVDYTYENTGYKGANGASESLYISLSSASIEDAQGALGYMYPGSVAATPSRLSKGESCKAQGRVGVDNPGNFTITFKMTDGNRETQQASFLIDTTNIVQVPAELPTEAGAEEAVAADTADEETGADEAAEDVTEETAGSEAA